MESEEVKDSQEEDLHLFRVSRSSPHVAPIMCSVIIKGQTLEMQVDTGADVSIIYEQTSKQLFPQLTPTPARVKLKTYTNEDLQVVGKLPVTVEHNNQRVQLDLLVVAGNGPSLMGRNWLESIHLDWPHINRVHGLPLRSPLGSLLSHHAPLFQEGLGTIQMHKATIQVAPDAPTRFFRPRPVPFAIRDAVGAQLNKLEQDSVLEKITHSSWAAPIIVVPKKLSSMW